MLIIMFWYAHDSKTDVFIGLGILAFNNVSCFY